MKDWRMLGANAPTTAAVKHTHLLIAFFFLPKHLFQAAGARLLCVLTGGGVIPFAAVIGQ
jgi:hypothetical protein